MISFFYTIRAATRMAAYLLALLLGAILILIFMLIPIRVRGGIRLSALPVMWLTRLFLWIFNIRTERTNPERLRNHHGIVICNHLSYVDVILITSTLPTRFLSAIGIRRLPLIGWITTALDTIYVNRGDLASRAAARGQIVDQLRERAYPPLTLFPEGRIGPGDRLQGFRHGAFEIARDENLPILPCAIWYDPLSVVHWYQTSDTLPTVVWRLAKQPRPVTARFQILQPILPSDADDAKGLAALAEQAILDTLPHLKPPHEE